MVKSAVNMPSTGTYLPTLDDLTRPRDGRSGGGGRPKSQSLTKVISTPTNDK